MYSDEPPPDSSRLPTEDDIVAISQSISPGDYCQLSVDVGLKVRDLTASIKDELHQKEIEALIEEILEAINDEPEFPGNMPDEVWEAIQKAIDSNNSRAVIQDIMQNVVKMTKTEIIKRVALKATHSKE